MESPPVHPRKGWRKLPWILLGIATAWAIGATLIMFARAQTIAVLFRHIRQSREETLNAKRETTDALERARVAERAVRQLQNEIESERLRNRAK